MARKVNKESSDLQSFLLRMQKALVRRAEAGDVDAVVALLTVEKSSKQALTDAVAGLRSNGFTWETIAGELGMTKQNAQKRWGKEED